MPDINIIIVADGSGGTYGGLYAANELSGCGKNIIGFNITDEEGSRENVIRVLKEDAEIGCLPYPIPISNIYQNYDYLGEGYGITSPELITFIKQVAQTTGIIVDPVYTEKALMGVVGEISKCNPLLRGNVLFIHTGGQFGIFPQKELFFN